MPELTMSSPSRQKTPPPKIVAPRQVIRETENREVELPASNREVDGAIEERLLRKRRYVVADQSDLHGREPLFQIGDAPVDRKGRGGLGFRSSSDRAAPARPDGSTPPTSSLRLSPSSQTAS